MHHTAEQLDILWAALKSSHAAVRESVLERYTNPHMPDAHLRIVRDDEDAQVISIPTPDHPGRHVYARKPGGIWSEQR